jgi:hypothetical protein
MRIPPFHLATNASSGWLPCGRAFVDDNDAKHTLETST